MPGVIASSLTQNQALGPYFFAEQDRLRGGPAAELCAPEYRAVLGGNPPMDLAGHEAFARAFYGGFADLQHVVEQVVAGEDAVAVRFTLHGTHTASFFGIPATQKAIRVSAIAILRVADGLVLALDAVFDEAGMLRQLGVQSSS